MESWGGAGPEIFNPQTAAGYGDWIGRRYKAEYAEHAEIHDRSVAICYRNLAAKDTYPFPTSACSARDSVMVIRALSSQGVGLADHPQDRFFLR